MYPCVDNNSVDKNDIYMIKVIKLALEIQNIVVLGIRTQESFLSQSRAFYHFCWVRFELMVPVIIPILSLWSGKDRHAAMCLSRTANSEL